MKFVVDEEGADRTGTQPRIIGTVAVPARFKAEMAQDSSAVMDKVWRLKQMAADIYGNLAARALHESMLESAKEGFLRSLDIRTEIGDREKMTIDLRNLGKVAHIDGDLATACFYWRKCVEMFRELERRDAGKLHVRSWTDSIDEMLDGMRASGCTDEASISHPSDTNER